VSDISRPGYRAARAIAEYAAFYGQDEPEARVRELVAEGIEQARAWLDEKTIVSEALDMLTNPDGW
jgi:hypothetical protein